MQQATVLILEDEEVLREALAEELALLGAKILTVENGKSALSHFSKGSSSPAIDVVVSDIHMPEMTGLEFLAEIRKMGYQIPVIIMTGMADKAKAIEALKLGAFDFIEKPLEFEDLRKVVQQAIKLGVSLRTMEDELAEICRKAGIPADQMDKYRTVQRQILLAKKATESSKKV